ncbi:MAG: LPS export ABC transporter periplasmic protein LptC, partial [Paracoccaceae bacterium]|nr:LPS export ABC transporter periplasmic protein LptC [Paracoccaceae bacterium]
VLSADNLLAEMQTKTGLGVQILSKAGMINAQEKVAALTDGVRLATTTGYLIKTESVTARLDTTNIVTSGGVSATGPLGSITAGDMEFRMKSAENGTDSFQLVFKNGVKLVYLPPKKEVDSK